MADPTLLADQPVYSGFTVEEITERLLAARGMTLNADTGRVLATTTEQTEAFNRVRRAMGLLMTRFPGVFTIQEHSIAWVDGDTMYALPASVAAPVWVSYAGRQLRCLNRLQRQALVKADAGGGGWKITGTTLYYFMRGLSNEGTAAEPDYRFVIELVPNPTSPQATDTLIVAYNAKAWALPSSTEEEKTRAIPLHTAMQEWLLRRAQEVWGVDASDQTTTLLAREERLVLEMDIDELVEGSLEYAQEVVPEFPTTPSESRDSGT